MNKNNLLDQVNIVGIKQISYTLLFDELIKNGMIFRSISRQENLVELFELSCSHSKFKIFGVKYLYVFILTHDFQKAEKIYNAHKPL